MSTYTPKLNHEQRRERRKVMADRVGSGQSIEFVAGEFGVGRATVIKACKEFGISLKKFKSGPRVSDAETKQLLADAVRGGKSAIDVSLEYGFSHGNVVKACREYGVPLAHGLCGVQNALTIVTKAEWEAVDWSLRDTDIAHHFGITRERVRQVRRRLCKPDSPAKRQVVEFLKLRDWLKDNADVVRRTSLKDLPGLIPLAFSRSTLLRCLKALGISCAERASRACDRVTKNNFHDFVVAEANGCWKWIGITNAKTGYGSISNEYAHRFAYRMFVGEIPADKWVLHNCDNPSCVNPSHLYLGTAKDNALDRERRGRGGVALFGADEIRAIRKSYFLGGKSCTQIARERNVNYQTIHGIVKGNTYKHVEPEEVATITAMSA